MIEQIEREKKLKQFLLSLGRAGEIADKVSELILFHNRVRENAEKRYMQLKATVAKIATTTTFAKKVIVMADIEKVIKGLEHCSTTDGNCQWADHAECPYIENCKAEKYSDLDRDVLELLNEQKQKDKMMENMDEDAEKRNRERDEVVAVLAEINAYCKIVIQMNESNEIGKRWEKYTNQAIIMLNK